MVRTRTRWSVVLWSLAILAVLAVGFSDRVVTRLAYALERGRIQAAGDELAALQDLPEFYTVSRAFKLVARIAQPGVVHIRVQGGAASMSEEELRDFARRHIQRWLRADEAPDREEDLAEEELTQSQRDALDLLDDILTPEELEKLSLRRRVELAEQLEQFDVWVRRMPSPPAAGSGIIFDPEGYILTNNHVVQGRTGITVVLHDGRELEAQVIGTDPKTDLAVVKIDAPDMHALTFGDSSAMEVGDWVLAVGSPFGLQQTVTHGILSAKGRTRVPGIDIDYQDFLQTDASINPGNSGGPLLSLRGEVVGVNTAIATNGEAVNMGVAFAIPSNRAARIAQQLKSTGNVTRGWLGISFVEVDPFDVEIFGLDRQGGVFVERVLRDSPAEQAGLEVEDVILSIDGVPVGDSEQMRGLIADLTPGDVIHLHVARYGQAVEVDVTLGMQPADLFRAGLAPSTQAQEVARLGMSLRTFRPNLLRQMPLAYGVEDRGVLVWRIKTGAWDRPPRVGQYELIIACDGKPVKTVADLRAALAEVEPDAAVRLEIQTGTGDLRIVRVRPPME